MRSAAEHAEYMRRWRAAHPGKAYEANKQWRKKNVEARNAGKQRNLRRGSTGRRRPWTTEEEAAVLAHECTDRELSFRLDRSVRAIQIRRSRLRAG